MSSSRRAMATWLRAALGISVWAAAPAALALTKVVGVGPGGSLTFSPATVTVHVGDVVEWKFMSGPHTTTRSAGPETWDSGLASAPTVFSHTFTQQGTFHYVCTIHQSLGMVGTVRVEAPTVTTTTFPPASCATIAMCEAALEAALPTRQSGERGAERRVAGKLARLQRTVVHQLDRAGTTGGAIHARAIARSRRALERLETVAAAADAVGTLGVPIDPIGSTITTLLELDQ